MSATKAGNMIKGKYTKYEKASDSNDSGRFNLKKTQSRVQSRKSKTSSKSKPKGGSTY